MKTTIEQTEQVGNQIPHAERYIPNQLLTQGLGNIASAALLRYGHGFGEIEDTRGVVTGDMTAEQVYKQSGVLPTLSEDKLRELDRSANDISVLSEDINSPEEETVNDELVKLGLSELQESLDLSKASHDAIKAGRTPREADVTRGIAVVPEARTPGERIRGRALPGMDDVQIVHILNVAGFERIRQNGSHAIYRAPDGRQVTVPVGHGDIATGTRDSIFNRAGIIDPREYM